MFGADIWETEVISCANAFLAPALPIIQLETRTFDGAIYNHNEYRGEPSAEIDEAWRRISVGKSTLERYKLESR